MKTLTSKSIYISIFFFSIYIIIDLFRNSYFRYFFWGSWSLSTRPHSPKVYKFSKHTFPAFWFLSISSINFSFFLNWGKDFYSCFNRDWFSKIFRDFTFDLLRYFSVKRKHINHLRNTCWGIKNKIYFQRSNNFISCFFCDQL